MNPTLILNLPNKFIHLLKDAVTYRINTLQKLPDDPNTQDKTLDEVDYGHDKTALEMIANELDNPNNQIDAMMYQLTKNDDDTENTLQEFGKPINEDEQIALVFSAKNWTEAMQIRNQFLGFEPYKPMPENIVINQPYLFKDKQGDEHKITTTIYQPQQFGNTWQCDYHLSGYGKGYYETVRSSDGFEVIELAMTAVKECLREFESVGLNRV